MSTSSRRVRVGVVGIGRGRSFAASTKHADMELVALCDLRERELNELGQQYGVATYTDYDRFLEHDLDAVVLANLFHQHAPFAIKALAAGKHVMSETSACKTVGEGVALCRAVERSGRIYMFAENYPFTPFNQEMRRLYQSGEIGQVLYAEGEYNHPMGRDEWLRISPGANHWRLWIPSTYYCTHALAPLMMVTDTMPTSVIGLSIPDPARSDGVRQGDPGSVILVRMDNNAVFRLMGLTLPGHSNWYRFHGTAGAMENERGVGYFGNGKVRVWHEPWNCPAGTPSERSYLPDVPHEHAEAARKTGHGGGDFWTNFHFASAIRSGQQPYLDVYRGVAMSVVGILAWKSALEGGKPFAMPNFSDEAARRAHENDHWSPFPQDAGPGQPPPALRGQHAPSVEALEHARKIWSEMGYAGT